MLRLDPHRPASAPATLALHPGPTRRAALRLGGAAALAAAAALGAGGRTHAAPPAVVRRPPSPPLPAPASYARIIGML